MWQMVFNLQEQGLQCICEQQWSQELHCDGCSLRAALGVPHALCLWRVFSRHAHNIAIVPYSATQLTCCRVCCLCSTNGGGAWTQVSTLALPFAAVAVSSDGLRMIAASNKIAADQRNNGRVYVSKGKEGCATLCATCYQRSVR